MRICPSCQNYCLIKRPSIGELDTTICDTCYWERYGHEPSEQEYFRREPGFWSQVSGGGELV